MCSLVRSRSSLSSSVFVFCTQFRQQSVPLELTTPEHEAIVTHLKSLEDTGEEAMRSFDFSLPGRPPLFIKQSDDILNEASTQHFFYLLANSDESAPRVPKVFDAFS